MNQVRADNDQTNAVNEALFDRWDHFSREATRFHEETEIEVQKATRQIPWFYIHKTLSTRRSPGPRSSMSLAFSLWDFGRFAKTGEC